MLLEAIITKADLDRFVRQLLPADIATQEGAKISLDAPFEIDLVPDQGARLSCKAKVHWPVIGLHVPIDLRSLVCLVVPSIGEGPSGATLDLAVKIEKTDFVILPSALDDRIKEKINGALASHKLEASWSFQKTLSHVFGLPKAFASAGGIALDVQRGVVKVTEDAFAFAVSFETGVRARDREGSEAHSDHRANGSNGHRAPAPPHASTSRPTSSANRDSAAERPRAAQLLTATGAGLALAAAFGLGRITKR